MTPAKNIRGRVSSWAYQVQIERGPCVLSGSLRSEERRVGKECRSLCDWSSDVCSSDLWFALDDTSKEHKGAGFILGVPGPDRAWPLCVIGLAEIGRASCRERV